MFTFMVEFITASSSDAVIFKVHFVVFNLGASYAQGAGAVCAS